DSNLALLHSAEPISKKYDRFPLTLKEYVYDGKNVWVGYEVTIMQMKKDSAGQIMDWAMPYNILAKYNDSLTELKKVYTLPGIFQEKHVWADVRTFSFKDSDIVYLPVGTKTRDTMLGKYYLNDKDNMLELKKAYAMHYPPEIPKTINGMPINYGITLKKGYQDSTLFLFGMGLDIYKLYSKQANLSATLPQWGKNNNLNSIGYYTYLPSKQQSFVILYKD
ncbi:MAG TPA: hypothetical protein VHZ76_09185, partial [Gammaproteobacteria bacterium]|nr:hypothetical protein [Gammaproteobacteria bacterium]